MLTRECTVETIRIPNVHWPLLIAYALFAYAKEKGTDLFFDCQER